MDGVFACFQYPPRLIWRLAGRDQRTPVKEQPYIRQTWRPRYGKPKPLRITRESGVNAVDRVGIR